MMRADSPDGYLAMDHDLQVVEASPWAAQCLLHAAHVPGFWDANVDFRSQCVRVLAENKPAQSEVR